MCSALTMVLMSTFCPPSSPEPQAKILINSTVSISMDWFIFLGAWKSQHFTLSVQGWHYHGFFALLALFSRLRGTKSKKTGTPLVELWWQIVNVSVQPWNITIFWLRLWIKMNLFSLCLSFCQDPTKSLFLVLFLLSLMISLDPGLLMTMIHFRKKALLETDSAHPIHHTHNIGKSIEQKLCVNNEDERQVICGQSRRPRSVKRKEWSWHQLSWSLMVGWANTFGL